MRIAFARWGRTRAYSCAEAAASWRRLMATASPPARADIRSPLSPSAMP